METQLALQQEQQPSIGGMLQAVIAQGVTEQNVAALDKLSDLYLKMQTREAEQAFARAFVKLQGEMPGIAATKPVPNKDGTVRYHFAPYEEIMAKVQPILQRHGFSVSFNTSFGDGRLKSICTLMHEGGHSRSNEFAVRIGGGPPGSTETQADGAAKTYAKRGALCDALNIVIEHDTDGADDSRSLGASITTEQAAELRAQVKHVGADEAKFLRHAGAARFEDIPESKLAALTELLARKKAKAAVATGNEPDAEWPK